MHYQLIQPDGFYVNAIISLNRIIRLRDVLRKQEATLYTREQAERYHKYFTDRGVKCKIVQYTEGKNTRKLNQKIKHYATAKSN